MYSIQCTVCTVYNVQYVQYTMCSMYSIQCMYMYCMYVPMKTDFEITDQELLGITGCRLLEITDQGW